MRKITGNKNPAAAGERKFTEGYPMQLKKNIFLLVLISVFLSFFVIPATAKKIFIQGEIFFWNGELYNIKSEWVPILGENQITMDKMKNGKTYTMELFRCRDWGPLKILIEPNLFGYQKDGILIYNIIPSSFIGSFIAIHSLKNHFAHGKELEHIDTLWATTIQEYDWSSQERLRKEYRKGYINYRFYGLN